MRALAIVLAAAAIGLTAGCGEDASRRQATQVPTATPSPAPPAPATPPRKRRVVTLTIGVSGDLLPHLPIVARARANAGGHGYDFRPMLRPIRGWVRANDLSFCHVETPLTPITPSGPPTAARSPSSAAAGAFARHPDLQSSFKDRPYTRQ